MLHHLPSSKYYNHQKSKLNYDITIIYSPKVFMGDYLLKDS